MSVKLCQLQHALKRRLELADLLVHGDSLDRESLGGIGIAHTLKTGRGLVVIAHAGVEVSNGVTHREILGIILEDLVVLSDGILQLALLDILLRSAEDLLFVEPETERHIGTNSSPWSYRGSYEHSWEASPWKCLRQSRMQSRWPVGQGQLYGWTWQIAWLLRVTKRECTSGLRREHVARKHATPPRWPGKDKVETS